jgi:hypothetical protein
MTGAFKATFIFNYVVAAMFMLFFLVLIFGPSDLVGASRALAARQLCARRRASGPPALCACQAANDSTLRPVAAAVCARGDALAAAQTSSFCSASSGWR